MAVSAAGIIINVVMAVVIIVLIVLAVIYSNSLKKCENKQSPFCYSIHCPCDDGKVGPCFGYAKMPLGPGKWACSNAPLTTVNDKGEIISQ